MRRYARKYHSTQFVQEQIIIIVYDSAQFLLLLLLLTSFLHYYFIFPFSRCILYRNHRFGHYCKPKEIKTTHQIKEVYAAHIHHIADTYSHIYLVRSIFCIFFLDVNTQPDNLNTGYHWRIEGAHSLKKLTLPMRK